jgi:hypothetical protein
VRAKPAELYILNLQERIPQAFRFAYYPKEEALELLRELSGEDFGFDADRWIQWARGNGQWTLDEEK